MVKFLFLLLFFSPTFLNSQTTFQKKIGGPGVDGGNFVVQTSDGGYIISGSKDISGVSTSNIHIVKTDSNGNIIWTKQLGSGGANYGMYVQETQDGGYIITGLARYNPTSDYYAYLLKLDNSGNILWSKIIGSLLSPLETNSCSIKEASDKGFIITGDIHSTSYKTLLTKTDSLGNVIWSKMIGSASAGTIGVFGLSVTISYDKGYIITGRINTSTSSDEILLTKTDSLGNVVWMKAYGGAASDFANYAYETSDHGIIMTGETSSFTSNREAFLLKTDSIGIVQWGKIYGGATDDYGFSVQQTIDEGFFVSGSSHSYGTGVLNPWFIKTDTTGNIIWSKTYGGIGSDFGQCGQPTLDGGYIATGSTDIFDGNEDMYLIKTDANGNSGCNYLDVTPTVSSVLFHTDTLLSSVSPYGASFPITFIENTGETEINLCFSVDINNNIQKNEITVYPNPSSGQFSFSGIEKDDKIEVFDMTGQLIYQAIAKNNFETINISEKASGIYFYRITNKMKLVQTGKICVE